MKRILALMMSISIATSSFSCANAIPVYADTVAGNYVSMSVMVSLLLSAYGIQRTIEGSQYINELIQQCTQEAAQSGFGMLKNGIQSIGVTIQNGVSYVQKSFAEWVYNWALSNGIYDISSDPEPEYYTFGIGNYVIDSGITFYDLCKIANVPQKVIDKVITSPRINTSYPTYIAFQPGTYELQGSWRIITIAPGTSIEFGLNTQSNIVQSKLSFNGVRCNTNSYGDATKPSDISNYLWNSGQINNSGAVYTVYNGLLGHITDASDLGYTVTNDIPDVSEDLDSYASDWVNHGISVDQDGTAEDYIPVTLPIDGVGTAVGVVEGTGEAINTAGAMDQYDVREGAISPEAVQDLEQAVSDSEAEEELNDDFTIHGLEQVFPFCLPWDFAHFISLLRADPVAPNFELQALNADGETISYTFDLSMFDSVALVCRNMELLAFIIALILITKGFFV